MSNDVHDFHPSVRVLTGNAVNFVNVGFNLARLLASSWISLRCENGGSEMVKGPDL